MKSVIFKNCRSIRLKGFVAPWIALTSAIMVAQPMNSTAAELNTSSILKNSTIEEDPFQKEKDGEFKDDSYPLSILEKYRKNPDSYLFLETTKECKSFETAFKTGLEQGLAAQRFSPKIVDSPLSVDAKDTLRADREDRAACLSSTAGSSEHDCCINGYKQAMIALASHLEKTHEAPEEIRSASDQRCYEDYKKGVDVSFRTHCQKIDACPIIETSAIRYLGCYHLGRAQVQLRCESNRIRALSTGEQKAPFQTDFLDKLIESQNIQSAMPSGNNSESKKAN